MDQLRPHALAGNQLLSQEYVKFDRHVHRAIGDGRKAIYGGAGFDISNYLLSINAPEAYFVGDYSDLSLEDFQDVKEALENATKHRDIMEAIGLAVISISNFQMVLPRSLGWPAKRTKKPRCCLNWKAWEF